MSSLWSRPRAGWSHIEYTARLQASAAACCVPQPPEVYFMVDIGDNWHWQSSLQLQRQLPLHVKYMGGRETATGKYAPPPPPMAWQLPIHEAEQMDAMKPCQQVRQAARTRLVGRATLMLPSSHTFRTDHALWKEIAMWHRGRQCARIRSKSTSNSRSRGLIRSRGSGTISRGQGCRSRRMFYTRCSSNSSVRQISRRRSIGCSSNRRTRRRHRSRGSRSRNSKDRCSRSVMHHTTNLPICWEEDELLLSSS